MTLITYSAIGDSLQKGKGGYIPEHQPPCPMGNNLLNLASVDIDEALAIKYSGNPMEDSLPHSSLDMLQRQLLVALSKADVTVSRLEK